MIYAWLDSKQFWIFCLLWFPLAVFVLGWLCSFGKMSLLAGKLRSKDDRREYLRTFVQAELAFVYSVISLCIGATQFCGGVNVAGWRLVAACAVVHFVGFGFVKFMVSRVVYLDELLTVSSQRGSLVRRAVGLGGLTL